MRWNGRGGRGKGKALAAFPLSVHSSGRYLVAANGTPFPILGDAAWSAAVQLTTAQIDTYLNDRAAKGFTAILFNAIEHYFSSQTPAYNNAAGQAPFTTMSPVAWTSPNSSYWNTVDYLVNAAKTRGMAAVMFPAYFGYQAGTQGWYSDLMAASTGDLQTYGAWLANRYAQGNVIWAMGGDYSGSTADRNQQWNIVTGIRSVNPNALITAHGARGDEGYTYWTGYSGWSLNTIYDSGAPYSPAATAWGRSGPLPFLSIEDYYEGEGGSTAASLRVECYQTLCSGGCGFFFGNNPVYGFGEPHACGGVGPASVLSGSLNTTGAQDMARAITLFTSYPWWRLVPKTDTSLVSSSLGSGTTTVCPALASDGSFSLIWVPTSQTVTVVMSALAPSTVRVRLFDPAAGSYSAVGTYSNSGTQAIATGGERVIVLDAA